MKAIVYQKYGSPDVLELQEVDKPVIADDQLLVRVCASSLEYGGMARHDGLICRSSVDGVAPTEGSMVGR